MSTLQPLLQSVQASKGIAHKHDIAASMAALAMGQSLDSSTMVGDDCAVLKSGDDRHLLFAIEGFINEFVQSDPWFAGYCGVMVNVSDIAAMGGRATAVVNAVWTPDALQLKKILEGMAHASRRYNVPIVGGHTNARNDQSQLAVSIIGSAKTVLSSFDAMPGDVLMSVIDLRGRFHGTGNHWNASTEAPADRLREDLELLPHLAESNLAHACKDISMAGPLGTTLMLLECSKCGAEIRPDDFPRPPEVPLERWMQTFPSFGFVLSVAPEHVEQVKQIFSARNLLCNVVGQVLETPKVWLKHQEESELLWDFTDTPLLGCDQLNQTKLTAGDTHACRSV